MACYYPWTPKGEGASRPLACGQCHGCRLEYARQWAVRCTHEASLHDLNSFITLTYSDECFSLDYSHFQSFMKRLRARVSRARIRFYMCGEYGELNSRAHFHACLFGFGFPDLVYLRTTPSGSKLYRSPMLESLWTHGFSSVGTVTFESAGYVARYAMKKVSGSASTWDIVDPHTGELFQRTAPFARMSLKPGIGAPWLERYFRDVYPSGKVVINGHEAPAPRYYDRIARARNSGAFMLVAAKRRSESDKHFPETLPDRLKAREAVSKAAISFLKRG